MTRRRALLIIGCLALVGPPTLRAEGGGGALPLFEIARNKNRNVVRFTVHVDDACRPMKDEPVRNHWRMLEIGPDAVEAVGTFEQMAYGIDEIARRGDQITLTLEALPERPLTVVTTRTSKGCRAEARGTISGRLVRLERVFVQADEGALLPKVRHVDLEGVAEDGQKLTERIKPWKQAASPISRASALLAMALSLIAPDLVAEEAPLATRTEWSALPALGRSSDKGFLFGGVLILARYEPGFEPYRWRASTALAFSVKETPDGFGVPWTSPWRGAAHPVGRVGHDPDRPGLVPQRGRRLPPLARGGVYGLRARVLSAR